MKIKLKQIIIFLIIYHYIYLNILFPFIKLFRSNQKFNELFSLVAFEKFHDTKYGYGISSVNGLKSKDIFKTRGDPLYNLTKKNYLFPLNKNQPILSWKNKDKGNKYLDFYYSNIDPKWSVHKDRSRLDVKYWIKTWDHRDPLMPKKRRFYKKKKKLKKSIQNHRLSYNLEILGNRAEERLKKRKSILDEKKKKLLKNNKATKPILKVEKKESKKPILKIKKKKPKKLFKKYKNKIQPIQKLLKRRHKWDMFLSADKNESISIQLESLQRRRRLTEKLIHRDHRLEWYPVNGLNEPIDSNKSLNKYPYKKGLKNFSPFRPAMELATWGPRRTRAAEYTRPHERKITKPLTIKRLKKWKKFIRRKRKWLINLNEHIKAYALTKSKKQKNEILKKWSTRRKIWKKMGPKLAKIKNPTELFYTLPYKNAQKRAKLFKKYFSKLIYCKKKDQGRPNERIFYRRIEKMPLQFDLSVVSELEEDCIALIIKESNDNPKKIWKIWNKIYDKYDELIDADTRFFFKHKVKKLEHMERLAYFEQVWYPRYIREAETPKIILFNDYFGNPTKQLNYNVKFLNVNEEEEEKDNNELLYDDYFQKWFSLTQTYQADWNSFIAPRSEYSDIDSDSENDNDDVYSKEEKENEFTEFDNYIQKWHSLTEDYIYHWNSIIGDLESDITSESDEEENIVWDEAYDENTLNELLPDSRVQKWHSLTENYINQWNSIIGTEGYDIDSKSNEEVNTIWSKTYDDSNMDKYKYPGKDYFFYINPFTYDTSENADLLFDYELDGSLAWSKNKVQDVLTKNILKGNPTYEHADKWSNTPPIHYILKNKLLVNRFFKWQHDVPPLVILYDLKRKGLNLAKNKKNWDSTLQRFPKLDNKFINKNFIDLKMAQKKYAIREAKFWNKFLKAKHNRRKKYSKRINKVHHTIRPYFNVGEEITYQAENALGECRRTQLIRFLSKLIFNKIDYPQTYFVTLGRFWNILDLVFDADSKHTIYYMLIHNEFITNYWCWWIKNVLKLLNKTQPVLDYWYTKGEKEKINFWSKYLDYIKKLSFNQNNIYNSNIILLKFITKFFLLIATFISFLCNFIYYWLENTILINISKFIEILSCFFN